jgi:hypothetical protein
MYKLQYDAFVRRHCHERRLMRAPKFGTREYVELYGRTPPVNGGALMQTLNKRHGVRVSDIEKEHGHYMADKIRSALARAHGLHATNRPRFGWIDDGEEGDIDWDALSIDPWDEFEAEEGFGYDEFVRRSGHFDEAPPDYTPIPQMEGSHSGASSPVKSVGSAESFTAPFSPDSSALFFSTRAKTYQR